MSWGRSSARGRVLARAGLGVLSWVIPAGRMLVLADRNFCSWALWHAAAGTGADLLWRVRGSMDLAVIRALPDGSFLAHVNDPAAVQARLHRNGQRRRRGSTLPPETGPLGALVPARRPHLAPRQEHRSPSKSRAAAPAP